MDKGKDNQPVSNSISSNEKKAAVFDYRSLLQGEKSKRLGFFGKIIMPKKDSFSVIESGGSYFFKSGNERKGISLLDGYGNKAELSSFFEIDRIYQIGGYFLISGSLKDKRFYDPESFLILLRVFDGSFAFLPINNHSSDVIKDNTLGNVDESWRSIFFKNDLFLDRKGRINFMCRLEFDDRYDKICEIFVNKDGYAKLSVISPPGIEVITFTANTHGDLVIQTFKNSDDFYLLSKKRSWSPIDEFDGKYLGLDANGDFIIATSEHYLTFDSDKGEFIPVCDITVYSEDNLGNCVQIKHTDEFFLSLGRKRYIHDSERSFFLDWGIWGNFSIRLVELVTNEQALKSQTSQMVLEVQGSKARSYQYINGYFYYFDANRNFFRFKIDDHRHVLSKNNKESKLIAYTEKINLDEGLIIEDWFIGENQVFHFKGIEKKSGDLLFGHSDLRDISNPVMNLYSRDYREKLIALVKMN
jgi:hypothetical protein